MKKVLVNFLIILILCTAIYCGCDNQDPGSYSNISPADAKNRLNSEEEIVLLDVRTVSEHEGVRIPGSLLIPLANLEEAAPSLLPNLDTPVFIYCHSGQRSITAANLLVKLGYRKVFNLGGIIDWPYEVVSGLPGEK